MRRFYVSDDAWNGYEVREPDNTGGRTVATHVLDYRDALLLAAAPVMLETLQAIVRQFDPDGVAAPDSARCADCGRHPAAHAPGCSIRAAVAAVHAAKGRIP